VQPFNGEPNLVLAIAAVWTNLDARKSLQLVLIEGEYAVLSDGGNRRRPEARRLLGELQY
jgi:hypothetical protein